MHEARKPLFRVHEASTWRCGGTVHINCGPRVLREGGARDVSEFWHGSMTPISGPQCGPEMGVKKVLGALRVVTPCGWVFRPDSGPTIGTGICAKILQYTAILCQNSQAAVGNTNEALEKDAATYPGNNEYGCTNYVMVEQSKTKHLDLMDSTTSPPDCCFSGRAPTHASLSNDWRVPRRTLQR